jgi:hypothetical protein
MEREERTLTKMWYSRWRSMGSVALGSLSRVIVRSESTNLVRMYALMTTTTT